MKQIKLGLLGLGQVGSGLYALLTEKKDYFRRKTGVNFEIKRIAVKHRNKKRGVRVPQKMLTTDALSVVRDPDVDVIVELIGGVREAGELVKEALRRGKHVVTANKALLAEHGDEIFECAHRTGRGLFFEASVGGGIPVIKALREGLVANRVDSILSIINGTSNYILTEMTEHLSGFPEALAKAKQKGYAEADPTLDVEGIDAAHKLAILVRLAFGGKVKFGNIYCEGISRISSEDIAFAKEFGYRIKLLALAKETPGGIEARVQPTLLPVSHILANVNGSFNAVLLHGDEVGDVLFYGRGAGPRPTASAVTSDLIDIAKRYPVPPRPGAAAERAVCPRVLDIKNISSILSRYYLRFHVVDRPGVLARISHILGMHGISISDCFQRERSHGGAVPLILLTHETHERNIRQAIRRIDRLDAVRGQSQVIRIES